MYSFRKDGPKFPCSPPPPPFNAQGWRVIIVVVQVGAVKIYVTAVEVVRKKERRVKTV